MAKKVFLFLVLAFLFIESTFAQTDNSKENYGTWTTFGINTKFHKWEFGTDTELRTVYFVRLINRWSLGVSADYNLLKQLKVGLGYQFMNELDYNPDYSKYYFFRNRFNATATGKIKFLNFNISLRERLQLTQKEQRTMLDGTVDTYSINPALVWRNRLLLAYNIPHCKITPSVSVESFYKLNDPNVNSFDSFRYSLSFDYKINKHNSIELYGVINSQLNSDDSFGKYILGSGYTYSF